jgi:hypothetical protein
MSTNVGRKALCERDSRARIARLVAAFTRQNVASPESLFPVQTAGHDGNPAASWALAAVSSGPASLRRNVD